MSNNQRPKTQEDLQKFHDKIVASFRDYVPPRHLMGKLNAEFTGYFDGQALNYYYWWLAIAVRLFQPKQILELGTNVGASSIMMYSEMPNHGQLTTVDILPLATFVPDEMRYDERVEILVGDDLNMEFCEVLPEDVDFLFIDTDHTAAQLTRELEEHLPWCVPGALVVLDDINLNDMREVWNKLPYIKLDITENLHHSGFGVFIFDPELA